MTSAEQFEFEGPVVEFRGPAPYFFVEVPEPESEDIKFAAKGVESMSQLSTAGVESILP